MMSRKMVSMPWLCSSLVSHFSASVSLDFPCTPHAFFPELLSNYCQGPVVHFFRDLQEIWWCSFVGSIMKSHRSRSKTLNKGTYKISISTQLREILYTDSQDMLAVSSTVASGYYNCCTDEGISPGNYGYSITSYVLQPVVYVTIMRIFQTITIMLHFRRTSDRFKYR
jgi:hypothetical protein